MKVLYAKGGCAIEEAERLFPIAGTAPQGGPDQFLLSVLSQIKTAPFQLVSLGSETEFRSILGRDAIVCGARPTRGAWWWRKVIYVIETLRFMIRAAIWRPTHVLCGIEGPFAAMALLLARWSCARFVFLDHVALDLPSISRINRAAHRFVVKRADATIVHGPFLRDQVIGLGARENSIFEFDTGFPARHLDNREALLEPIASLNPASTPVFVYVGRIEEEKGVFDLLEAFYRVRRDFSARLVFIGDGAALEKLKILATSTKFSNAIEIHGSIPHDDIFSRLQHALAVVTPTQSRFPEGRCMAAMEAFSVGTPVIAPDFGPFPYLVIDRQNGLLYRADDVSSLAQAMSLLLTDAALYDTVRAGAKVTGEDLSRSHRSFDEVVKAAAFTVDNA